MAYTYRVALENQSALEITMPTHVGSPANTDIVSVIQQRAQTPSTLRAPPESNTSRTENSPQERPEGVRRPEPAERRESNLGNNVDVNV